MSGSPEAQIPFNFFAGLLEESATTLAWETGYLYVITSIVISTDVPESSGFVIINDAEGNRRLQIALNGGGTPYPQFVAIKCEIVLGPTEGAQIYDNVGGAYASVDGYAFAPVGSNLW